MSWRERLGRNWGRLGMRSEWITSTIDDICKLVTDGAHNSPKSVDNGYYMASVKDFTAYGFDFSNCRKISEADYLKLKKQGCVPESGDILVGKDGARYFEDVIIYRQKEQPALLSSIAILRVDDTKVTSEFLYYTLKSPAVKKAVRDNYGSGSAIPRIVLKDFKRMPISFPSLKEQKKITNICELLDEKIQLNNRINNNLEQQAQTLFDNFYDSLSGQSCILSEIIDISDGTHDSPKATEHGYPLVTSKHLLPFGVDTSSANIISKADYDKVNERSKVNTGDILISMIGTVGLISYVIDSPVEFAIKNVGLFKTSKHPSLDLYILYYLKNKSTTQHIEKCLAGSTQKYISLGELRKLPIVVPSPDELAAYNLVVRPIVSEIALLMQENRRLSNLRDTLLPKLMSGELDVSGLDI